MADDRETRELRDRVRNLEMQLRDARGGGGNYGPAGCMVAAAAVLGVVVIGAGAAGFLLVGRTQSRAADDEAAARATAQEAELRAEIAQLRAQIDEQAAQLGACTSAAATTTSYVDDDAVYDGRVTAATGASHVHVGDTCRVDLEWTTDPSRNCRAQIVCGTHHLYGDVGQGWFTCRATEDEGLVSGSESEPTSSDGDPIFSVDRITSTVQISDESPAWSVTLSIQEQPEE